MDNTAGTKLAEKLEIELIESDLIWELGNFTTNGKDVIVTDQVLAANKLRDVQELHQRLIQELDIDPELRFHSLNANTWDMLTWELCGLPWRHSICHIDGYLRFVDEHTIVASNHILNKLESAAWQNWREPSLLQKRIFKYWAYSRQKQNLLSLLLGELGNVYNITRLDHEIEVPAKDDFLAREETIPDTRDYINYLRFGSQLLLPQYSVEKDDKASLKIFERLVSSHTPVKQQFVLDLAKAGGVLNCASWVLYDERVD